MDCDCILRYWSEGWDFVHTCEACGMSWIDECCPHDEEQNSCPRCEKQPESLPLGKDWSMVKYF